MQATNATLAMDPYDAAEHMMAGIAAGDFWIFSDDAAGKGSLGRRAERLGSVSAPPDPWPTLGLLGVSPGP
jgi:hypothetical protein